MAAFSPPPMDKAGPSNLKPKHLGHDVKRRKAELCGAVMRTQRSGAPNANMGA
jgi:hypothetical protein